MTRLIKIMAASITLAGLLALTACGTSGPNAANSASTPVPTNTSDAVETSPAPTPTPSESQPAPTEISSKPPAQSNNGTSSSTAVKKQLEELLALAKLGQVPGIKFRAHVDLIDAVTEAWGKSDVTESAGKGIYATYSKKNAVIGFNKGSKIFDVRSSAPELRKLTLKQIEQTLGKPEGQTVNGDDNIYLYNVNKSFQLKFIIPKSTGKVHHISVFSPKDSKNLMAG
ncbi:YjgB family protein [Cohnella lupini]|uniref:Uncharacterized protein DUF4309 n=1 Tax=Cohnella lupini TaxID=1294267 RepID=A0A3D9ISM4_9BACL|nr:YjgB family protein [Cohnella lupini]RED64793.1 uncharacterized protein DUF4309 [Cohnella lupini]